MRQLETRLLLLLLCFCILLSASACQSQSEQKEDATSGKVFKSAEECGVMLYGFFPEKNFPTHPELREWYEAALDREQLTNAIFYSYDQTSALWHCWLYVGERCENDTLNIQIEDSNDTRVLLDGTRKSSASQRKGAVYFTIPGASEPRFSLTLDGELTGLLQTLGKSPAITTP